MRRCCFIVDSERKRRLAISALESPSTTYPRISLWRAERRPRFAGSSSLNRYYSGVQWY